MRDPARIPEILKRIETIWTKFPDWRLSQLLLNALATSRPPSIDEKQQFFYTEDDKILESLNRLYDILLNQDSDDEREAWAKISRESMKQWCKENPF